MSCTGGNIGPNGGATISIVVSTIATCQFIMDRAVVNQPATVLESNSGNNVAFAQTACGAGAATATPLPTLTPSATSTNTPLPTGTATPSITPFAGLTFTKSAAPSTVNRQPADHLHAQPDEQQPELGYPEPGCDHGCPLRVR